MSEKKKGCSLTLLEVLLICLLLGGLAVMLLPAVQSSREAARRLTCQTKQKDIALACNLYEGRHRRLPPSCHVKLYTTEDGVTAYNKDGYSFLVGLLPEMEQEALYKWLNVEASLDEDGEMADKALAQPLSMFRCPSSHTSVFNDADVDMSAPGPVLRQSLTNYKAVSGTTRLAYEVSSRTDTPPGGMDIYGSGTLRTGSDGVMYPGSRTTLGDITDGAANTLLSTESEERIFARWTVGQECGVYTMRDDAKFSEAMPGTPYVHPAGYVPPGTHKKGKDNVLEKYRQTNLNRDYESSPYPWGETGFRSAHCTKEPAAGTRQGPGSGHRGVVFHAFVGGQCHAVYTDVDTAVYFSLTTRAGADPVPKDLDSYQSFRDAIY